MNNFQKELLNEFEKIASEKNLKFVVEKRWANCGAIYLMDNFKCIAEGSFDFQTRYANISFGYPTKLLNDYNANNVGSSYIEYNKDLPQFINEYKEFVNTLERNK